MPLPNTCADLPPSTAARFCSSRVRVGLETRAYSYPLFFPISSCTYVDVRKIGTVTAPVEGSGSWPTWMAVVANPSSFFFIALSNHRDELQRSSTQQSAISPFTATRRMDARQLFAC